MNTLFDIGNIPTVTCANDRSEWYTPPDKVEPARRTMGSIDLDPASCHFANTLVKAATYLTRETDGFSREWWGNVWCNPPYSDYGGQAADWCEKTLREYLAGRVKQCVLLVNLDQFGQEKIQETARHGLTCIHRGRIAFIDANGNQQSSPRYNNLYIYLGQNGGAFIREFSPLGIVQLAAGRVA